MVVFLPVSDDNCPSKKMGGPGGGGAECPPETFHQEIFGHQSGKMRQGKKVQIWEMLTKMRKNGKKKDEN